MNILEIKRIAREILENKRAENSFIEYKKSITFKDKILKTVCAFGNNYMNNEMGLLFIGIEEINDKETKEKAIPKRPIFGIEESKLETTENELKALLSNIYPKIKYHLISDKMDDQNYIVVAVESNQAGPFVTTEKAEENKEIKLKSGKYIRTSSETRLATFTEEFELLKKFANFNFSSSLNETATLNDLDYEYMKEYLVKINAKQDIREMSKLEMAKALGLMSSNDATETRVKNFAVLMFAENPAKFIPGAYVQVIREVSETDVMESQKFEGPIWIQLKRVIDYFKYTIMTSNTIRFSDKIEHEIIYNYPLMAFEELITNAILHKDYEVNEYVGVYVYKDEISFVNHNKPLPPVTIEDMNTKTSFDNRKYLNREIKDMFFNLNLIESYGSGIRRAKQALKNNNSPELEFLPKNNTDNYTNAKMKINKFFLKNDKKDINNKNKKEVITSKVSDKQKQIIKMINKYQNISAKDMAHKLDLTIHGINYHLNKMKKENIIRFEGSRKIGRWVVIRANNI
ncbi:RNA-binding domain-containing protein [Mycoplasma procyoni]|uniref:RNA-binding domain-containing protein n=1 Tax=Mycoplasma procyoni TaxID=568784 RepID=UPI00197C9BF9|nr:RNA-binding domain-containing protein [Mycoplasma procyoni]MBN3534882.1 putative DNA binding domain-containing protein [Mycoplasma procyoni]